MSAIPRIFVTGVSGYVGGHTVLRITEKHPQWHLVVLVRNKEQSAIVKSRWPQIETVIGDLDDKELMVSEASKADVVLRNLYTLIPTRYFTYDTSRNRFSRPYSRGIGTHRGSKS